MISPADTAAPPAPPFKTTSVDLLDGDFYVNNPYETYAWLREHDPIHWDETNELFGISRYDDIVELEKNKATFISSDQEKGGYRPNMPADPSIIGLDDPEHTARRRLVARRFTPKAVSQWEPQIRQTVTQLIDTALERGQAEVIADLAAPLPAMMIGHLLGFPDELWPMLKEWSERTIALGGGPRYFNEDGSAAVMEFAGACVELYEARKGCPVSDVMSLWTQAEADNTLGDYEFGVERIVSDCLLLLDGGAETTRTTIARTLLNLIERPDQWELLRNGADAEVATEEFIRYVTPIHNMCRTAVEDYEISGTTIPKGNQVVLMYSSANRDPQHFDNPEVMDITRSPNHHIAFGFGTHFCLGAALARLEIKVFFEEFAKRVKSFELTAGSEVVEMPNAFVYGLAEGHIDLVAA